jgi:methionine synthase II (cobalamin-independent)
MRIKRDIYIEDLIELLPSSVQYLSEEGIKCIACGEPIWGTLEQAAREKGFDEDKIDGIIRDLNEMLYK